FTDDGQATGQYRAKYATIVGQVARTHCPPMYKDWAEVQDLTKDALWEKVLVEIDLPLIRKECTLQEDKTKRFIGKLAREQMKNPHTTGRMGAGSGKKNSPTGEVSKTEGYVAIHTRRDGSCINFETKQSLEEIDRLVSNEPNIVERDLDNDPVALEIAQREKRARENSESGYEAIMARLDEADKACKILEDEVADIKRQSSGLGNAF
ncbi:hypothetical protein IFM89_013589, partial [Coptis chinensis]